MPFLHKSLHDETTSPASSGWSRRKVLKYFTAGGVAAAGGILLGRGAGGYSGPCESYIASVGDYDSDLTGILQKGVAALSLAPSAFKGKRILIKPNLVEPHAGMAHINTHPAVIRAVVELFRRMDAAEVIVAEGAGHRRDYLLVLEASGFADAAFEDRIPFVDLNTAAVERVANRGRFTKLKDLYLPREILRADVIVSLAKMKTHHWAGVTLSMKNLFGIMPGAVYGWPKNVLHQEGIQRSILDINSTVKPHLSIIDGIVGMEGDGPIMGAAVQSKVLVMGTNSVAVDATAARVMGIDPHKIPYLSVAGKRLGPVSESCIKQCGLPIRAVRKNFATIPAIPAQRDIRLS